MFRGIDVNIVVRESDDNILLLVVPCTTFIYGEVDLIPSPPIEGGGMKEFCI